MRSCRFDSVISMSFSLDLELAYTILVRARVGSCVFELSYIYVSRLRLVAAARSNDYALIKTVALSAFCILSMFVCRLGMFSTVCRWFGPYLFVVGALRSFCHLFDLVEVILFVDLQFHHANPRRFQREPRAHMQSPMPKSHPTVLVCRQLNSTTAR
ncbi:hypothetical protein BJ508DRAFT_117033 [Ascobolus immersus RN42]|uniref:Uncharacterized protein n=1 Tax=Ascobolus immersus RN42 TaxID=1160509 RepID=A0A3N4I507_ASCIM|nr:hypothetical protein BJ508DRAFT_117033 [Ascobolus immersus RN42]